jgi:serine/threonine protein kinase
MVQTLRRDWEQVGKPLGEGGQSEVHLVRTPARTKERASALNTILNHHAWATNTEEVRQQENKRFVTSMEAYCRPDTVDDLGAMTLFTKIRGNAEDAQITRLGQEIAVLDQEREGLPKLLGANLEELWMVTEYFPAGTLEDNIGRYKGRCALALKAFESIVKTVAKLHDDNIVHRDIKPANVFVKGDELVL